MPSIDEYLNPRGRVLERRGTGAYGIQEWSVFYANPAFVVVGGTRRGTYYVVPNEHAGDPQAFSAMMTDHQQRSGKLFASMTEARRVARQAWCILIDQRALELAKSLKCWCGGGDLCPQTQSVRAAKEHRTWTPVT